MKKHGNWKHGETRPESPEYRHWYNMMRRCYDINFDGYSHYGDKGIKVCRRWHDYRNFLADMGRRPDSNHTLGRINNNRNYTPKNCRWETRAQQSRNRKVNKLTIIKVRKIRFLYTTGKYTHNALAIKFKVGRSQINKIINGYAWKETTQT